VKHQFNHDRKPHVRYTETSDGVVIGFEEHYSTRADYRDVVLKYTPFANNTGGDTGGDTGNDSASGLLTFQSEDGLFDNIVGTYELDDFGKPTNLNAIMSSSRSGVSGTVLGQFAEPPRMFMIRNGARFADESAILTYNGTTGVRSNGSAVPLVVYWSDVEFNSDRREHVRYTETADGVIIGMEDYVDNTFDDVVFLYVPVPEDDGDSGDGGDKGGDTGGDVIPVGRQLI